ncbi:MAG: hypothetical protein DRJ45_02365 [Thermoprotei archaeon]|nr:MAG: hypothetical protein DRJ45_02365 [Thermoprotei archaeon]
MVKRTTIILEDDVYEILVRESLRRYGNTRSISKVLNEILRESIGAEKDLIKLLYSKKLVKISLKEFEKFRKNLSKGFEER